MQTALGSGAAHGVPLAEFSAAVFAALTANPAEEEIGFGPTASPAFAEPRQITRKLLEAFSGRFPIQK